MTTPGVWGLCACTLSSFLPQLIVHPLLVCAFPSGRCYALKTPAVLICKLVVAGRLVDIAAALLDFAVAAAHHAPVDEHSQSHSINVLLQLHSHAASCFSEY